MNKTVKNWIFIILSIIVLIGYLFYKEGYDNIVHVFSTINYTYFIYSILSIFSMILCDAITMHIIRKQYQKDARFLNSLWIKTGVIFFALITPMQIGGVAAGITLLSKNDMNTGDAATVMMGKAIAITLGSVILYSFILLTQFNKYNINWSLQIIIFIGYLGAIGYIILLFMISVFNSFLKKATFFFIKLGAKIKLIKNKDKVINKANDAIDRLSNNMKSINSHIPKKYWLALVLFGIGFAVSFQQTSFFIYNALGLSGKTYFEILGGQSLCNIMISIIPIPGGFGIVDAGFHQIMSSMFGDLINYGMLLWRVFAFYLPVLISLTCFLGFKKKNNNQNDI